MLHLKERMENIEFDKLFEPSNKSVIDFFRQSGAGYYIPEYQRGYSWDKDNIIQLLTDISDGVDRLVVSNSTEQEIHFLGTIITVIDQSSKNKDPKGKPTRTDMIIDGQQRILTISIMSSIFVKVLIKYLSKINETSPIYDDVKEVVDTWCKRLMDIVSFDLLRGKPQLKPKVIRGGIDYWTSEDDINIAYVSDIAHYEAELINAFLESKSDLNVKFPVFSTNSNYSANAKRIERWLNKTVGDAHILNDEYPNALDIINSMSQEWLWEYERPILKECVEKQYTSENSTETSTICSLVQTLAACYYLLQRCCFCVIKPENEDWAFDMFQSLNATGTPLTALETFKPVVVNYFKTNKVDYKGSITEKYFSAVENFLSAANTAVQKTKRTNDLIVSFFAAYNGEKVPTHFSGERRALVDSYNMLYTAYEKEAFIKRLGDYSRFYDLWSNYEGEKSFKLNDVNEESELISMLILFLKKSNHRMAITTLGSMYQNVIEGVNGADKEFIETVKATTAFYYIWRTMFPNNGLDNAYRAFFKDCYKHKKTITSSLIKEYFMSVLEAKDVRRNEWKQKAGICLRYSSSNYELVKLALLISATDTIPDPSKHRSIKKGKEGSFDYLKLKLWSSKDLKTIEHIAPQTYSATWDKELYNPDTMFVNSLGNLTLLPVDINSSIGNKSLNEKLLYYKSVAEDDPDAINKIKEQANAIGAQLTDTTIELLRECKYAHHIRPISCLDYSDSWKVDIVRHRTNAMLDIIFDKLLSWLE